MSNDADLPQYRSAEILTEISARVEAELPLLPDHLRTWLETHLTHPREISAVSDPDGACPVRVWLVTDHIGDSDASSRVVYDAAQKAFGLVMELQNGALWYMGRYGSLVDTVDSM